MNDYTRLVLSTEKHNLGVRIKNAEGKAEAARLELGHHLTDLDRLRKSLRDVEEVLS